MAGVGFELKKLFRRRGGYINTLKAYAVSAVVTEGPMLLTMLMLFATRRLLRLWGAVYGTQEVYLITTTYIMIFSLILSNTFLMFISRFISDCIYEGHKDRILHFCVPAGVRCPYRRNLCALLGYTAFP